MKYSDFQWLMLDNVALNRWEDSEGNPNCHKCECPLVMHMFGIGCGEPKNYCSNPNCKNKKRSE
jgi:hypothetical protein